MLDEESPGLIAANSVSGVLDPDSFCLALRHGPPQYTQYSIFISLSILRKSLEYPHGYCNFRGKPRELGSKLKKA
jgi:hypothetical protein